MNTPAGFEPGVVLPADLPSATRCFVWRDDRILVGSADPPALPTLSEVSRLGIDGARLYLGRLDGVDCLALRASADAPEPEAWQWRGLRSLFLKIPDALLALAGRAFQIVEWDRSHRFCGRCGTATEDKAEERAKICPTCGHVVYPRVSPAMMVLVTRGRELLLARANRFPAAMFSALAGFVESGESIEDCIRREVREEVGIEVDNLHYFASQSWPFPHSLMIGWRATWASGEITVDETEIVDAAWYRRDDLPTIPPRLSIARSLIDGWLAEG